MLLKVKDDVHTAHVKLKPASRHLVSACNIYMSALSPTYGAGPVQWGVNECVNSSEWNGGLRVVEEGHEEVLAWIGVYRHGGGRVRQGRSGGGRVRGKEETRQKFAIMSVEEGAGGWCVEEKGCSGWWRSGRESGRTSVSLNRDICQRGPLVCVCICVRA